MLVHLKTLSEKKQPPHCARINSLNVKAPVLVDSEFAAPSLLGNQCKIPSPSLLLAIIISIMSSIDIILRCGQTTSENCSYLTTDLTSDSCHYSVCRMTPEVTLLRSEVFFMMQRIVCSGGKSRWICNSCVIIFGNTTDFQTKYFFSPKAWLCRVQHSPTFHLRSHGQPDGSKSSNNDNLSFIWTQIIFNTPSRCVLRRTDRWLAIA